MSNKMILCITLCIFCFFPIVSIVNAQFPTDGVVGYWSFDAGTINGNTVQDVLG